jgi:hypothetical protein
MPGSGNTPGSQRSRWKAMPLCTNRRWTFGMNLSVSARWSSVRISTMFGGVVVIEPWGIGPSPSAEATIGKVVANITTATNHVRLPSVFLNIGSTSLCGRRLDEADARKGGLPRNPRDHSRLRRMPRRLTRGPLRRGDLRHTQVVITRRDRTPRALFAIGSRASRRRATDDLRRCERPSTASARSHGSSGPTRRGGRRVPLPA